MSSASRRDTRKILMRTAATALIAASPFVYSGASAATTSSNAQLTAPTLKSGTQAKAPLLFSVSAANFQLTAPIFQGGKLANLSLGTSAALDSFKLNAPTLAGFSAVTYGPRTANQPVQNLLAVPMDAQAGEATISASAFSINTMAAGTTTVDNSDDITVSDTETAIDVVRDDDHVVVNNSGDLTGGGGINVVTGVFDPLTADTTSTYLYGWISNSTKPIYNNAGNYVTEPCAWDNNFDCKVYETTTNTQNKVYRSVVTIDNSDAAISIDNSGNVAFSGIYGIRAENETGASIDINNSGDVTATSDTERRVGIYANTTVAFPPYAVVDGPNEISPGEYTYNSYDQLTGVITPGQRETTYTRTAGANDAGSIRIENSGNIDMGAVHRDSPFESNYAASEGITAIGSGRLYDEDGEIIGGGIEIVNSGSVKVGDFSLGITAVADGGIYVQNSGTVEIGNKSTGITISDSGLYGFQIGDDYRRAGDNLIVNTGDIIGGLTNEEALASDNADAFGKNYPSFEMAYVVGIRADVRNTNNEYYARQLQGADEQAYYAGIFGEEFFPLVEYDKARNYTTTIRNDGNIILKDGGRGIVATANYGELRVINGGTIVVGDGTPIPTDNHNLDSAGIWLQNFTGQISDLYAKNEATGIIVTGDASQGMNVGTWYGNKVTMINEGSITTGSGLVVDDTHYLAPGVIYDGIYKSIGMNGTVRGAQHSYTYIRNSGDVTTGDLSLGIRMYANSTDVYLQGRSAGLAFNEGTVTVGDNSIGILAAGAANFRVINTGTIIAGDRDISGYNPSQHTANVGALELAGFGIWASAGQMGYVANDGTIQTGNGTVGIFHGAEQNPYNFNGVTTTVQGVNGIISTGDDSIGMKTHSGLYNNTYNYGTISVGDGSVGIEASAGFHYTNVLDTIQYGACHMVNFNGGLGCTADTVTTGYTYAYSGDPIDWDNLADGSRTQFTQEVSRPGQVTVNNAGIIETGDHSVGVRLAGVTSLDYVHYRDVSTIIPDDILTPEDESGRYSKRTKVTGEVETNSSVFFYNSGTVRVGADSTAVEIIGKGLPNGDGTYGAQLINIGTIDGGGIDSVAIKANVDTGIDTTIFNGGTIIGDILFGAGDDLLFHGQDIDPATGQVMSTGNIIMNGNTINFGGGENRFVMQRGVISVAGGDDNVITGDNLSVEMIYGEIDARDDFITGPTSLGAQSLAAAPLAVTTNFSTLTIEGDVSGNFRFATDVAAGGLSDELIITGNVADGSSIGVIVNPVEQLKGEYVWRPIHIDGTNDADIVELAGVSGLYADSFLGGEAVYDAASGDVVINATFGLGHMGTAANAAAISAGNWLTGTLSSYGHRNIQAYTGRKGEGLAVWGFAFQDEGRIQPDSDLQDLSFSEISTGLQAGVQWSQDIWGGRVSVSPMFTYGTVEANLRANTSSSRGHPWAVGLNANYAQENGLYVDATYQHMSMDVDLKTPQTATAAKGDAKINGQGFNLEAGYAYKLSSGLVVEPQLQLTHVKVDMDDFASSDDIYSLTDIDGKATTLRAGVSVYKVFETSNGSITPMASLSYLGALNGKTQLASNGVDFDSDTSGSGYKAEIGLLGRYQAWDFAGKLGVSNTSATGSILQPSMTIRYGFGAAAKASAKSAAVPQLPEVTEATVKFAEAGNTAAAPLATAASAQDGAPVVSAAYAQTGAEPTEEKEKKEEQAEQTSPELAPETAPENPMDPDPDPDAEPAADEEADEVTDITVTGSLIRRSTATEATPITVVTSEDMAERGLMTLGEVMQSFTQNEGYVQGKASNLLGRFTFGAEEINFRGLGAGRTLVLVNGRRIADYPLPFGGEQNGVDLGTIPYSAIAKVEYLSAGASATYGSDAVGGVVNIITKRDMEQTSIELTGGMYQQGFGETGRIAAITGNSFERGSFTVGVEGYYSGEILASDAKYFRKHAPFNAGMIDILENTAGGQASVLPQSACAPLGFEFDNGQCTSNVSDTISLNPKAKQGSAFFDGRYDLTDRIELFGTAMGSIGKLENRSNVLFWQGVVANEDNSGAMFITRGFSEDELGISKVTVDNNMWTAVVGAKGGIDVGGGTWYWDVAASHASFHTKQTGINLKEEGIKNWILNGASSVTDSPDQRYTYFVDPDFYNNQLIDNIVRPVQPADVDALRGENVMKANSSAQSLTATLNGTFGDLGFLFKPVKFAVRAEYGRQVTEINPDDRTLNTSGEGWFNIGAVEAKGKRNRWALAAEVDTSVLSNLDVVLAGRYDHYDDDSSITGRFTGQAKFLYRPTDWLKVRGGYGQTFRAPDMFNIYGRSDGFEVVPDFSAPGCFDGSTYVCGGYQVASTRQADPGLKEEHGDDLGLGIIVNPLPGFQFTVDWYNIHLKDLVLTESSYDLILKEWQCANGVLDGSSALCADVNNRVIRNGFGALERVIVQPINSSNLTRSGIDIQASYGFESAKLGSFNFNLGYSRTLKFELTRFKGDESIDLKYGEPGSATPGNNLNFGVNWYQPLTTGKGIAAGLFVQRTGRVYNFDQSQFLEPFYDVNLSAAYQLNTKTSFRLNVNNVLNTKPQENGSGFWPGYWAHLQTANALGRSAYVSLNYSFN